MNNSFNQGKHPGGVPELHSDQPVVPNAQTTRLYVQHYGIRNSHHYHGNEWNVKWLRLVQCFYARVRRTPQPHVVLRSESQDEILS